jgi:pentose-5-phosphate-3-epimerase
MIAATGERVLVGVDGGITCGNIAEVLETGPDLVVTGSAVFDGKNAPANATWMLQQAGRKGQALPAPTPANTRT